MRDHTPLKLAAPAHYFPLAAGRYEVRPGLFRWGHDFGNGECDRQVFQFDSSFDAYRTEKLAAREERLGKYVAIAEPRPATLAAACHFITQRLSVEHPDIFQLECSRGGTSVLHSQLTTERVSLDTDTDAGTAQWTALGFQIQEDLALIEKSADGMSRVSALHLCLPNYWGAEAKIGRSFSAVHGPVPGFDRISQREPPLLNAIYRSGPFVRFAWGVTTDRHLNHHPEPPPLVDPANWTGRRFNPDTPSLFLRVERQVLWGLEGIDAAVFCIRTYLYDCASELDAAERAALANAVEGMSTLSSRYKGLEKDGAAITQWLRTIDD